MNLIPQGLAYSHAHVLTYCLTP